MKIHNKDSLSEDDLQRVTQDIILDDKNLFNEIHMIFILSYTYIDHDLKHHQNFYFTWFKYYSL